MVFSCVNSILRSANAAPLPPNLSPIFMLELPTFRWGATRLMRYNLPDSDDDDVNDDEGTKSPASLAKTENEKRKRKRKMEKMAEFSFRLTKVEIDEDFFGVTGARAPRWPKRRHKAVQCEIESLFPGLLLPKTLAPDRYMVPY